GLRSKRSGHLSCESPGQPTTSSIYARAAITRVHSRRIRNGDVVLHDAALRRAQLVNRTGEGAVGTPEVKLAIVGTSRVKPADANARSELRPAPSGAKLVAAFAAVYVLWGSTFLAIRFAVATLPPFLMAGTRHLVAGLVLYPLACLRGRERPTRANWTAAALVGALLLAGGNGGVSWAEQSVPSGVAALLVATVSLWMVLIEWLRPGGTRPGGRVILGLVLGFGGLAFLMGPSELAGAGRVDPRGATVLVLAAVSWATGSVFSPSLPPPSTPFLLTSIPCP